MSIDTNQCRRVFYSPTTHPDDRNKPAWLVTAKTRHAVIAIPAPGAHFTDQYVDAYGSNGEPLSILNVNYDQLAERS